MTMKCALAKAFLEGKTLSILTAFKYYAVTNLPREASRLIEQPFNIRLTRKKVDFTSQYGQTGYYYEYHLEKTPQNAPQIEEMYKYVRENYKSQPCDDLAAKRGILSDFTSAGKTKYTEQLLFR